MSIAVVIAVRILEGMFLVGTAGCLIVLILTGIEDIRTLLGKDDDAGGGLADHAPDH